MGVDSLDSFIDECSIEMSFGEPVSKITRDESVLAAAAPLNCGDTWDMGLGSIES